jgi:hypothetical protein
VAKPTKKRSRANPETALVQTRISLEAKELLDRQTDAEMMSEAALVRRVLYRHLGLLKEI